MPRVAVSANIVRMVRMGTSIFGALDWHKVNLKAPRVNLGQF